MSLFVCPVCGAPLVRGATYRCPSGHCFDMASSGHVNLLPVNKKHSLSPGDGEDMVKAREIFLSAGYYSTLRDTLCDLLSRLSKDSPLILTDVGCGEGYYTQKIAAIPEIRVAAFDISKAAAKRAAKRLGCKTSPNCEVAVASAFDMPLGDGSVNCVLNVFSPLHLPEIRRVLKDGGYFVYAVPSEDHLWELKSLIYDEPYKNAVSSPDYEGFEYLGKTEAADRILISDPVHVRALFTMTPYFWHTPKSFSARLAGVTELETRIGFDFHLYRKTTP